MRILHTFFHSLSETSFSESTGTSSFSILGIETSWVLSLLAFILKSRAAMLIISSLVLRWNPLRYLGSSWRIEIFDIDLITIYKKKHLHHYLLAAVRSLVCQNNNTMMQECRKYCVTSKMWANLALLEKEISFLNLVFWKGSAESFLMCFRKTKLTVQYHADLILDWLLAALECIFLFLIMSQKTFHTKHNAPPFKE